MSVNRIEAISANTEERAKQESNTTALYQVAQLAAAEGNTCEPCPADQAASALALRW
jgi:hypothetical protein